MKRKELKKYLLKGCKQLVSLKVEPEIYLWDSLLFCPEKQNNKTDYSSSGPSKVKFPNKWQTQSTYLKIQNYRQILSSLSHSTLNSQIWRSAQSSYFPCLRKHSLFFFHPRCLSYPSIIELMNHFQFLHRGCCVILNCLYWQR